MFSNAADAASRLAPLLPQMLGANGETRSYLIVAMTNSEIRAVGGMPGSQGVMTITNGVMEMGDFQKVMWISGEGVSITDEEYALFQGSDFTSDSMRLFSGDSFYDPNFPRAADRLSQFWQTVYGDELDGVIALDPALLQYILGVVGGVASPDGTIVDGSNAVKYLMNDVYWQYASDSSMQDAIFSSVAQSVFDALLDGLGDSNALDFAKVMMRGADEGRLLVWMRDSSEEQAMENLGVAGSIENDPTAALLGVFVNDYSFTKSDYYLDLDTVVGEKTVNSDGSATYLVSTTLKNAMPVELENELPPYFRANNHAALSPGDLMTRLYLYAPAGGSISNLSASGDTAIDLKDGTYNGVSVAFGDLHLQPGQALVVTYQVTTSTQAGDSELVLRSTPTVQDLRG